MSAKVLADKDVNAPMIEQPVTKDVKSMEYHRQVLQSKMAEEETAKPKSLFAQASAKKLQGDNPLGAKPAPAKAGFQL
ncbi:hypothetical protein LB505_002035 [Fusarium chuoi]|nr:hypothetical protein LB505_002035 [Fusarium chuoi]